MFSSFRLVVSK